MLLRLLMMDMSLAAFEPGIFLGLLFVLAINVFRYARKAQFESGQEEDEERQILRMEQIEDAMSVADEILSSRLGYYARLSTDGKKRFLARLRVILATKRFYGKEGLKLTPEVEVLTAAAIVQVTFGLRTFDLERFNKIVIYPDIFYNKLLNRNLKGSTSPSGVLRFSWKHLSHGFEVEDDNINLALHETAHALKIIVDEENDYLDTHLDREMAEFFESGDEVRNAILEGKLTLIRKYASTNEHEFFACCVEYFFESPAHFKKNLPRLYFRIAKILQQDPTNVDADHALIEGSFDKLSKRKEGLVFGEVKKTEVDDDSYTWLPWLLVAGVFLGIPGLLFFHMRMESSMLSIALFHLTITIVGIAIFRRRLLLSGYTSVGSFMVVILLGWWPVVAAFGLLINDNVPVYSYTVVENVRLGYDGRNPIFYSRDSELRTVRKGVRIEPFEARMASDATGRIELESEVYYGLLGLRVYGGYTYWVIDDPEEAK